MTEEEAKIILPVSPTEKILISYSLPSPMDSLEGIKEKRLQHNYKDLVRDRVEKMRLGTSARNNPHRYEGLSRTIHQNIPSWKIFGYHRILIRP